MMDDPSELSRRSIEVWKPVLGYEPYYEVSNLGRVRSIDRRLSNDRWLLGRVLRPTNNNKRGYWRVALSVNDKLTTRDVHQLVAEGFIGPRPDGMVTRHLDDDKDNNFLFNIGYGTYAQNSQDFRINGGARGRLTADDVLQIKRMLATGYTARQTAEECKVSVTHVRVIARGAVWQHVKLPRPSGIRRRLTKEV